MKNTNILDVGKGLAIGFIIVLFFLWLRGCQSDTPQVAKTIETKEVKGKFEAVKPKQEVVSTELRKASTEPKYITSNEDKFLQGQIDILIAENKALQQYYNEASDSLKRAMYDKAIELKKMEQVFDNDKLRVTVYGMVRGEVQDLGIYWTIKPQTIELPKQKETFLRVLVGGGIGINKELNQPVYKANAGFQNRKGNIIRGSFQKIGSQDYYLAEYDFSILNWKR